MDLERVKTLLRELDYLPQQRKTREVYDAIYKLEKAMDAHLLSEAAAASQPPTTVKATTDSPSDADGERTPYVEKWWASLDFWDKVAAKKAYEQAMASTTQAIPESSPSTPSEAESGRVEHPCGCVLAYDPAKFHLDLSAAPGELWVRCRLHDVSQLYVLTPAQDVRTTSLTSQKQESHPSAATPATESPASASRQSDTYRLMDLLLDETSMSPEEAEQKASAFFSGESAHE